jgi:hypothetical protein
VLARIAARVQRLLKRRGLDPSDADPSQLDRVVKESPALAGISSASIHGRVALGPRAVAQDRRRLTEDGRIVLELKTTWQDGTSHLVFEPLDLLARRAAPPGDSEALATFRC